MAQDCFPAVLDRATFDELQVALGQPSRQGPPKRHPPRLASGIVTCGRCGLGLMQSIRSGSLFYSCPSTPTGCGRLHLTSQPTDDWLLERLAWRAVEVAGRHAPDDHEASATAAVWLAELAHDYYVDRIITRAEFLAARSGIAATDLPPSRSLDLVVAAITDAADPRRQIRRYGLQTQRDLCRYLEASVVVSPGTRGKFDPRRLDLTWGVERAEPAKKRPSNRSRRLRDGQIERPSHRPGPSGSA
ncbi:MAG: hypothetical protein M3Q68_07240 [Actinomycetota bacterium]|nr:hypothetical protein [Actinomycetota bacterium]